MDSGSQSENQSQGSFFYIDPVQPLNSGGGGAHTLPEKSLSFVSRDRSILSAKDISIKSGAASSVGGSRKGKVISSRTSTITDSSTDW